MKLIQELTNKILTEAEESGGAERSRARVQAVVQKVLDKEFAGNDALATDLLTGMMQFYDYHLRQSSVKADVKKKMQDAEDALRQLLPRAAKVSVNGDTISVELGTMLDAAVHRTDDVWELVVTGYKRDIPVDQFDSLEELALVIKDIARQGKKWYEENDPDGDRW